MKVLGTRIDAALDDDRARTLLASDLHVPLEGGAVVSKLQHLLADACEDARATRLLILGDLFDSYIGQGQLRIGVYGQVVDMLAQASAAGLSVTVLRGNRDFLLGAALQRASKVRVVPGGLTLLLGKRRVLTLHGDELCLNDLSYQRAKRWLRHPLTRALLAALPLSWRLRLASRARRRSEAVVRSTETSRLRPTQEAVRAALEDVDLLVFGHIHEPARGVIEGLGEYCVLPAFDAAGVHLEFASNELRYRDLDGSHRLDYPARDWLPFAGRQAADRGVSGLC